MIDITIRMVQFASQLLILLIIVDVFLSYFLPLDNRLRISLDRIISPLLNPIRKILPTAGGLDFSPLVLLILIQIIESVLVRMLYTLR